MQNLSVSVFLRGGSSTVCRDAALSFQLHLNYFYSTFSSLLQEQTTLLTLMYVQEFQVLSMWVSACQVDPEELHGRPDHLLCGLPEL